MIFHPLIIALLAGSVFVVLMVAYSSAAAVGILRKWDLGSGSELQLALERKTYLVSTLLAYVFAFELLSFFLYILTADRIQPFFVGAMCAAGSLNVNGFGYPTLVVRLVNFLCVGVWLILNHVDSRGFDYPLIKVKYRAFLILAPLVLLEGGLQAAYFLRLKPDIITSCCGTLFSAASGSLVPGMGGIPRVPAMAVFYAVTAAASGLGLIYWRKGRGGYLFSGLALLMFAVSVVSIFAFISPYIYELPTHRCPFCMLQKEYGYIGYPLYLALLSGTIAGFGVGVLMPFRRIASLSETLGPLQRRLALIAAVLFLVFAGIVTARIAVSNLVF